MSLRAVPPPPPADEEPKELIPPRMLTADQLFAEHFEPLVWTVPGLLVRGNCDMLAGKSKMGKSRLGLSLAWAISFGALALGSIEVVQGDVLYLGLEDGFRRIQTRLYQMVGADPNDPSTWPPNPNLVLSDEWSPLDEGGIQFITQWIDQAPNPTLVVVDTLKKVKGKLDSRKQLYDSDYEAIQPLTSLAHSRNVGILVVHHTRKAEADDVLDEVSGSTGLTAVTDGTLILKRKRGSKEGTLFVVNRDAPEDIQMALIANQATGGWTYVGDAETAGLADARAEILAVLIETRDPMKPAEIAPLVNRTPNAVQQRLHQMMKDGQVRRTKWAAYVATDEAIVEYWNKSKNVRVSPDQSLRNSYGPMPQNGNSERENGQSLRSYGSNAKSQEPPESPEIPGIFPDDDSDVPF